MRNAGGQLAVSWPTWPGISADAKRCVSRLLEPDVNRRATVAEILQHPCLVQHGVAMREPFQHVVVQRMRQASFLQACLLSAVFWHSVGRLEGSQAEQLL